MLGTNDLKHHLNASAHESARGISALLQIATNSTTSFSKGSPKILVIAPPRFGNMSELMTHHFKDAIARSAELPAQYEQSCAQFDCSFIDSNQVATVAGDGIHLDAHGHRKLALALVPVVKDLIDDAA
jgi:lysophospholipase L1-like esterase